jgi:hypothetical protein
MDIMPWTGFTPTGQCCIEFDEERPAEPGALPTRNLKTRCALRHVCVVPKPTNTDDSSVLPSVEPFLVSIPNTEVESEIDLVAQLVALKLKSSDCTLQFSLDQFISLVRTYTSDHDSSCVKA